MMDSEGNIIGILALHVDDAVGGGTAEFHRAMQKVSESLEV